MSELIREDVDLGLIESAIEIIQEGMASVKNFFITGPFMQANCVNGNKRSYPREIIEREMNNHLATKIKENRALGELGHPPTSEINLDRVSHMITNLHMEGDSVIGKAKVLDTPMGKIVKSLMESGVKLGVSTRGVGSLKNGIVQNDFKLICVDVVSDPSGPACFVNGILESNKEWVIENGILVEKEIEAIKKEADQIIVEHKYSLEEKQAAFMKLFQDSLEKIGKRK
jgi:hypothetical protein